LIENEWLISSMEKSTPPIGAPKATATPAALDAVRISLILPDDMSDLEDDDMKTGRTD
jgi:hypothetical protein